MRKQIKRRATTFKSDARDAYDKLVARQCRDENCFKGWAYLWDLEYRTQISNDPDLAASEAVVHDKYTRNKELNYDAYEKPFVAFLNQDSRASKITNIKNFEFDPQNP
ncbi:MAG: hypothetical protein RLZZ628_2470 [Bacteroidota bacterium]